jgi:hypothetical protein
MLKKRLLFEINNKSIYEIEALKITCFKTGMAIDADGYTKAYHPDNTGLDDLVHAGHTGNWWGIATDNELTSGNPILQKDSDPAPGYYVSTTSLVDKQYGYADPKRYVDAIQIPYFVLPKRFLKFIKLGDIAWIYNAVKQIGAFAVFADVGPDVGEGSMRLAEQLNIPNHPRHGGMSSEVLYFIFNGTGRGNGFHLSEKEISQAGENAIGNLNVQELIECLNS